MKLSKGIQTFWVALGSHILLSLSLFLYFLAGNDWRLTNLLSLPDLTGFTLVVALVIFPLLWFLSNVNLNQLLQNHLNFRQQILTNLCITVAIDVSWQTYKNLERQATIFRKQSFRHKNLLLAMLEATLFEMHPKSEWLGDYPKEAVKRRRSNL